MNIDIEEAKRLLANAAREIKDRKFTVSIIGQTGVGKSSLINALFGTNLKTDAVRPCTTKIEENQVARGLYFYDLPGIGESEVADTTYLQQYKEHLEKSDVVLWAIHSDNRSILFDLRSLTDLLKEYSSSQKQAILSKLIFVLTKADVLHPPAWIASKEGDFVTFIPSSETRKTLDQKIDYYTQNFIAPFGEWILSRTYNDCNFNVDDPKFEWDDQIVSYKGHMNIHDLKEYKRLYPSQDYEKVFTRLFMNYQVIPCSSIFRFGLSDLANAILAKLGDEATIQFKNLIKVDNLTKIRLNDTENLCNLCVYDSRKRKFIFEFKQWISVNTWF